MGIKGIYNANSATYNRYNDKKTIDDERKGQLDVICSEVEKKIKATTDIYKYCTSFKMPERFKFSSDVTKDSIAVQKDIESLRIYNQKLDSNLIYMRTDLMLLNQKKNAAKQGYDALNAMHIKYLEAIRNAKSSSVEIVKPIKELYCTQLIQANDLQKDYHTTAQEYKDNPRYKDLKEHSATVAIYDSSTTEVSGKILFYEDDTPITCP